MNGKEDDNDRQSLLDTADENTQSLVEAILEEQGIQEFLHRSNYLRVRSSNIVKVEQELMLNFDYDVDGIVLALSSLQACKFQIRYFNFHPHIKDGTLPYVYNILRKHLCLQLKHFYSNLDLLKKCKGFKLFCEHGWDCYLTLIPVSKTKLGTVDVHKLSLGYFSSLVLSWRHKLRFMQEKGICLDTIRKNALSTCTKLHLLPDDQNELFSAFSKCLALETVPEGFAPYLFIVRFGERKRGCYSINDFYPEFIKDQSIHIAITLSGSDNFKTGFLWAKQGLQTLIGERGNLSSCLSFSECGNFQSNLDGRSLDISPQLRRLVAYPQCIRFVQFYGDTPHVQPKTRPNPISGSIVNCGLLHENSLKKYEKDSVKYIQTCYDNIGSLQNLSCRLEFVIAPNQIIMHIEPDKLIREHNLRQLIEQKPLLVPFDMSCDNVCSALRGVVLHLINKLHSCFLEGKRRGCYELTWTAYQCELAIEKFIWGRPLSPFNNLSAINLGPGVLYPSRSRTDWLGFLALEEPTSTTVEESPPPLKTWISSDKLREEVEVLFGFSDYTEACNAVLGKRVITILLKDFYLSLNKQNDTQQFGNFLAELKSLTGPQFLVCKSVVSIKQLVRLIFEANGVKSRGAARRMFGMLNEKNLSIQDILESGLITEQIRYFPAVKTYDSSRNHVLTWDGLHVWKLIALSNELVIDDTTCQRVTQIVLSQLGTGNYVHQSKLNSLANRPDFYFPWVYPILLKLNSSKLSDTNKARIILFCSCVALLQQGWYVDFHKVTDLERSLPLSQFHLKRMEIQSSKILGCVSSPKIWRLHESILVKISMQEPRSGLGLEKATYNDLNIIDVPEYSHGTVREEVADILDNTEQNVVCQPSRHCPVVAHQKWSPEEIEILHYVKEHFGELTGIKKYKEYQLICNRERIPDRTFKSFERKMSRT